MARSFSNAKLLSSLVVDQLSVVVARRGYAVAAQGNVRGSAVAMMMKGGEEPKKSTPWIPDPITGYYRPEGHANQVDEAELREMLLKQKTRRH